MAGHLSGRLPVVALVGHYPTNKLIGRGPIPHRKSFPPHTMKHVVLFGIRPSFPGLSQRAGRSPTCYSPVRHSSQSFRRALSVRLVCVKHAASVRPEPESNSPNKTPTPKRRAEFKSENLTPNKTPKTGIQNHTPNEKTRYGKNNKQKPPNTLLSSQTTDLHFATCSQATLPAYFRVMAVSTRWSNHFQILRSRTTKYVVHCTRSISAPKP